MGTHLRMRLARRGAEFGAWLGRLSGPLERRRTTDTPFLTEVAVVQSAGRATLTRSFQRQLWPAETRPVEIDWKEQRLWSIPEARVSGLCGSVFLPDGELLDVCPWSQQLRDSAVQRPNPLWQRRFSDRLVILAGRNEENHGHFLFEYLPRYAAIQSIAGPRGPFRVGLSPRQGHWHRRYLALLGVPAERMETLSLGTNRVEELLYLPVLGERSGQCDPKWLKATIDLLRAGAERRMPVLAEPAMPGTALFVSRSDAPNRRILNEDRLIELTRASFPRTEVVRLAGLTFEEQLRRFAAARVILGSQGQGLGNIAFLSGRILVCLEAGQCAANGFWEITYPFVAELGGNAGVTLYSGTERVARRDYVYPEEKFAREIARLAAGVEGIPAAT